jgi:hypothetical protein
MIMGFQDILNSMNNGFKARAEEARVEQQRQANEARAAQERRTAEYLAANPPQSFWRAACYHTIGFCSLWIAIPLALYLPVAFENASEAQKNYSIVQNSNAKQDMESKNKKRDITLFLVVSLFTMGVCYRLQKN